MGSKQSKPQAAATDAAAPAATTPTSTNETAAGSEGVKQRKSQMAEYKEFRDDLLSFSLGEAAFDYAKRLSQEQPDNPALLALFGETAWMYEKVKNPVRREHWVDRMDVFQQGIDATRKCIKNNPDYAPCLRVYVLLAAKASEQKYWFKLLQPFGPIEHYDAIMNRGRQCMELDPEASDVLAAMGQVTARVASNTKRIWTPYTWYAKYKGLPHYRDMFAEARKMHHEVQELEPKSVSNACRLAMIYYEEGNFERAKRWYQRTRDELICEDPAEEVYQTIAHTHLTTHVARNGNWNLPFG